MSFKHFLFCRFLRPGMALLGVLILLSGCSVSFAGNPSQSTPTTGKTPNPGKTPASQPQGLRPFADTWENIHHVMMFDYNVSSPEEIAGQYDMVFGAKTGHVSAYRSSNPNIFLTYYIPFHRGGRLASSSLRDWQDTHPDWILYQCDRTTPAYEFNDESDIPLDFSNPAVLEWQIQTYARAASEQGFDGIAADNLNLNNLFGACGYYSNGQWVQRYSGKTNDPKWTADVINWLKHMQQKLHALPHPLALIGNMVPGDSMKADDPRLTEAFNALDGWLDEAGFTRFSDGYLTDERWVDRIDLIERIQEQHKPYYSINQFKSVDPEDIEWALASYLMGKGHYASIFISAEQGYGRDRWFDKYNPQIGTPEGRMVQKQHVYWREYSHGLSIVNPSDSDTYTITLPDQSFRDLVGQSVSQTITLPPHSGKVLLLDS